MSELMMALNRHFCQTNPLSALFPAGGYRIRVWLGLQESEIASLTMSAVSSVLSNTRLRALGEERHFALVEELLFQPRLAS